MRHLLAAAAVSTLFITSSPLAAQSPIVQPAVEVYSTPPAINPLYPDDGKASSLWEVEVLDPVSGAWISSLTYEYGLKSLDPHRHHNLTPKTHWTTFGVNSATKVRCKLLQTGSIQMNSVRILPSRYDIPHTLVGGNSVEFVVKVGQKVYVEVDGQDFHTLFLFVNPPKPRLPAAHCEYYGPGIHVVGEDRKLGPNDTIYLDEGAWVIGSFDVGLVAAGTEHVHILGPGVISGSFEKHLSVRTRPSFTARQQTALLHTHMTPTSAPIASHDILVDGPTLVGGPDFNITLRTHGLKELRNTHVISPWTFNTDFISGDYGQWHIHSCFVFNGDDTGKGELPVHMHDCVIGGRNSLLIGYGRDGSDAYASSFERIDIVLQESLWNRSPIRAQVFQRQSTPPAQIRNQIYRDIRIDSDVRSVFKIVAEVPTWAPTNSTHGGLIEGIVFEDVKLFGQQTDGTNVKFSEVGDFTPNPSAQIGTLSAPLIFRNVVINGQRVTNSNFATHFNFGAALVDFQ